jgi:phosphatidylserine/phosphatidylglycerophosphate/cardiolipin synthase-like enzyme
VIGSRRLLEAWEPPSDAGHPLACVATSFTFDADFFETECIGRFLGLSWQREAGTDVEQLASLLEQEGALRSARVTALVDRSVNPEKRSLSWDVLPVGIRGGLLHAKVALLGWENAVRIVVGSANLTPAGYREQVEAAVVMDVAKGCQIPFSLVEQTLRAVRALIARANGSVDEPGAKQRAEESLEIITRQVRDSALPEYGRRRSPRVAVTLSAPGQPALKALDEVWAKRGPPRTATILSPFFDSEPGQDSATRVVVDRMARTGPARLRFVLPTDVRQAATLVRAPRSLGADVPHRLGPEFYRFGMADPEPRRLHAKVIVLESDEWVAAIVGSSNFTRAGLGLSSGFGHLEVNFAIGCATGSRLARELAELIPIGSRLTPGEDEWELDEDEDEVVGDVLPWGFGEALLLTGTSPRLRLTFDPQALSASWWVRGISGELLIDHDGWEARARPDQTILALHGELPTLLDVEWREQDTVARAAWAVNVDQPSGVPLPDQLKGLRLMDLVYALQSSRPLAETLARALEKRKTGDGDLEMDPLVRFSGTGRLLQRTRMVSGALAGLHPFLERPAPTIDALHWRLHGPVGPGALAKGFEESASEPDRLPGEAAFMLAELALTLKRIDWTTVASPGLSPAIVRREVKTLQSDIRDRAKALNPHGALGDYVTNAIGKAK